MVRLRKAAVATAASLFVLCGAGTGAWAGNCAALLSDFDRAVHAKDVKLAEQTQRDILDSMEPACDKQGGRVHDDFLKLRVSALNDPSKPFDQRKSDLTALLEQSKSWIPAAGLGDVLGQQASAVKGDQKARRGLFQDAAKAYEVGIALMPGDASNLTPEDKMSLLQKASAAKILASNDTEGKGQATFAGSTRFIDGSVGGIYSDFFKGDSSRQISALAVPVPINFESGTTRFTPNGQAAVDEMVAALKAEQGGGSITLVGHTDPRGSDEYNMELSRRRVQTVSDYLRQNGVSLSVSLVAKGRSAPFDASVLPYEPTQDEVYALDRRVELVR